MAYKMKGFPMQQTSALKKHKGGHNRDYTTEEFAALSDEKKKKLSEKGVKQETKAHEKYHGKPGEKGKGESIEKQLKSSRKPGGTTTLSKAKYNSLVNRLEKIYRDMYPDPDESNVRGTYGEWKPYEGK